MTKIASRSVIPAKTNEQVFLLKGIVSKETVELKHGNMWWIYLLVRLSKQHVKMVECLHKLGEGLILSQKPIYCPQGYLVWQVVTSAFRAAWLAGRGNLGARRREGRALEFPLRSPSKSNACHTGCFHSTQTILDFQFGPEKVGFLINGLGFRQQTIKKEKHS